MVLIAVFFASSGGAKLLEMIVNPVTIEHSSIVIAD